MSEVLGGKQGDGQEGCQEFQGGECRRRALAPSPLGLPSLPFLWVKWEEGDPPAEALGNGEAQVVLETPPRPWCSPAA